MNSTPLYSYRIKKKITNPKIPCFRYSYTHASNCIWDWSLLQTISMKTVDSTLLSRSAYNSFIPGGVAQQQNVNNAGRRSEFYFWRSLMITYSPFLGSVKKRNFNQVRPASTINFCADKVQLSTNFYYYWLLTLLNASLFSLRKVRGAGLTTSNTAFFESWASASINTVPTGRRFGTLMHLMWVGEFLAFLPVNLPSIIRSYGNEHYPFFLVPPLSSFMAQESIGRIFVEFFYWAHSILTMENHNSFSEMNYEFFVLNKAALRVKRVTGGVAQQKLRSAASFTLRKFFAAAEAALLEKELEWNLEWDEFFEDAEVFEPVPEPDDLVLFWETWRGVSDINIGDHFHLKLFNWWGARKTRLASSFLALAPQKILLKIRAVYSIENKSAVRTILPGVGTMLQQLPPNFNYINSTRPLLLLTYILRLCVVIWSDRILIIYLLLRETSSNNKRYLTAKARYTTSFLGFYLFTIRKNFYLFFSFLLQKWINFTCVFYAIRYAIVFFGQSVWQFLPEKSGLTRGLFLWQFVRNLNRTLRVFSLFTLFLLFMPCALLISLCLWSLEFIQYLLTFQIAESVSVRTERPLDLAVKLLRGFNGLLYRLRRSLTCIITASVCVCFAGLVVNLVRWRNVYSVWFSTRGLARNTKFKRADLSTRNLFLLYLWKRWRNCAPLAYIPRMLRNICVSTALTVRESVWQHLFGVLHLFGSFGWWVNAYCKEYSLIHLRSMYLFKLTQSSPSPQSYIRGSGIVVGLVRFIIFFFFEIFVVRGWIPASVYLVLNANLLNLGVNLARFTTLSFDFSVENSLTRVFFSRKLSKMAGVNFFSAFGFKLTWGETLLGVLVLCARVCKFVNFLSVLAFKCFFDFLVRLWQLFFASLTFFYSLQVIVCVSLVSFYVLLKLVLLCILSCLVLLWFSNSQ